MYQKYIQYERFMQKAVEFKDIQFIINLWAYYFLILIFDDDDGIT